MLRSSPATALPVNVLAQTDQPRLATLGVRRISTGSLLFRAALGAALAAAEAVSDSEAVPPVLSYDEVQQFIPSPGLCY